MAFKVTGAAPGGMTRIGRHGVLLRAFVSLNEAKKKAARLGTGCIWKKTAP